MFFEDGRNDVVVIGGGVVGMSCALELARRGLGVVVLDRGRVGHGCSYGNAGWLTPCFAMPLPAPGMIAQAAKWLFDPDSPLYVKPAFSWALVTWLARFVASMTERRFRASTEALTALSVYSLDAYAKLAAETTVDFGFRRSGLVVACETARGLSGAIADMRVAAGYGIPGEPLSVEALRAKEPAVSGAVTGGVLYPEEAHVEPLATVEALAEALTRAGGRIFPDTEVFDFETTRGRIRRIRRIRTTQGWLPAQTVVLAAGSWSRDLARRLALRVPVLGGKGYAMIVPPLAPALRRPLMLIERKIAVTPREGSMRVAGTLELVSGDDGVNVRRLEAILRGARRYVSIPADVAVSETWRGLRPCTPDGMPIIGFAPRVDNLLVVTGHQMLGLQSAPGTARLAADLVTGAEPVFDPRPFRAGRF